MNKKIINYLSLISFLTFPCFLFKVFSPNEMDSFWNYSSAINLVEYKSYFDLFFSSENKAIGLNLFKYIPTFLISLIYKLNGHQYTTIIFSNYLWLISLFISLFVFLRFEFKSSFKEILFYSMVLVLMEPLFRGIISLRAESISIIFTLNSMRGDSELLIYWSAGRSNRNVLIKPILIFSTLLFILQLLFTIIIIPSTSLEDDFKYSADPIWQKIYKDRLEPNLQEYSNYPDHLSNMVHFIKNDFDTALYDAYLAIR